MYAIIIIMTNEISPTLRRFRVIHESGLIFTDDHELEYRYPYLSEFDAMRVSDTMIRLPVSEEPVSVVVSDSRNHVCVLAMESDAIDDVMWQMMSVPGTGIHVYNDPKLDEYAFTIPKNTKIIVRNRLRVDGQHVYELFPALGAPSSANMTGTKYIGYDFYHYAFLCPPLLLLPMKSILVGRVVNPDGLVVRQDKEIHSSIVGVLPLHSKVYIKSKAFSSLPFEANVHRYELVGGKGWINVYGQAYLVNVEILGHVCDHLTEGDMHMNMMEVGVSTPSENPSASMDTETPETCISCMQRKPNAVFVHGHTGHVVCCLECSENVHRRKMTCPLCRMKIDRVIRIY